MRIGKPHKSNTKKDFKQFMNCIQLSMNMANSYS